MGFSSSSSASSRSGISSSAAAAKSRSISSYVRACFFSTMAAVSSISSASSSPMRERCDSSTATSAGPSAGAPAASVPAASARGRLPPLAKCCFGTLSSGVDLSRKRRSARSLSEPPHFMPRAASSSLSASMPSDSSWAALSVADRSTPELGAPLAVLLAAPFCHRSTDFLLHASASSASASASIFVSGISGCVRCRKPSQ
mmetsp:Transcript_13798/g.29904  ORF Transcript_13798/g.29904 Transcript_13798/m.29904 type:complete len:201 (-) Transcript_13798:614-1216(-)